MKNKKYIRIFIKLIIIIASYSFIVYKLYNYNNLLKIVSNIFTFHIFEVILLFLVLILMLMNWITESLKWKYIIREYERVSLLNAIKAILAGITVSLFTPNRTGEFGGRILTLKKFNRTAGALSTIIGSTSQLLVTILLGSISLILLILLFNEKIPLEGLNKYFIAFILLAICLLFTLFYFNIKIVSKISKLRWLKKYEKHFHVFSDFSKIQLSNILFFSTIRYIIFIIQFYCLFIIFNVDLSIYQSLLIITASYYVVALIPSITLAELGIRGSVIVFFTEIFIPEFAGALSASIVLWIINLAIPALIGSVVLYRLKI